MINSNTLAQQSISFSGNMLNVNLFDKIITKNPDLDRFIITRWNFRVNITYWQTENIGTTLGFQVQRYRMGFVDSDPIYFAGQAHANMAAFLFPINIVYRKKIFNLFKKDFYVYGQAGVVLGFNPDGINKKGPYDYSMYFTTNGQITSYYDYTINYNFSPIFAQLDVGLKLDYQIFKTFSIGLQVRYYQGLEKIGRLNGQYRPKGYPFRTVEVETKGSAFMIGFGGQFHIPLKKKMIIQVK